MASEGPEQTESLFNVTPARRRSYLVSFIAYSLIGYGVVRWHHVSGGPGVAVPENATGSVSASATAMSVMLGFAIAHAAAFGLALTTAEITGGAVVIADWLRAKYVKPLQEKNEAIRRERIARQEAEQQERIAREEVERERQRVEGRVEGRAKGRAEGHAEVNRIWREWNQRRREAEARGEAFNEPEPFSEEA